MYDELVQIFADGEILSS